MHKYLPFELFKTHRKFFILNSFCHGIQSTELSWCPISFSGTSLAFHGQMFVKMVSRGGDVSESAPSNPSTRNSQ